ncbi:MAG TPA: hypothetical protein DGT23_29895 [Micromonosporaceae bacterium]|nr:hypothetical protein [Micromonosporaceae bacterium]
MLRRIGLTALVICLLGGCTSSSNTRPGPIRPNPAVTATDGHGEDAHDETAPPPLAEAPPVAAGFAEAWTRTKAGQASWWAGVAPWCEEGLAEALRTTDPGNVPAATVNGPAVQTGGSAAEGLRFEIPTNAGTLTVTVAALGGAWKVTTVDFSRGLQ